MYNTSNPAIKKIRDMSGELSEDAQRASYKGVALKSLYFIGVAIIAAILTTVLLYTNYSLAMYIVIGAAVGTLIFALIAAFVPSTVKVTGSLYVLCQGILLGAISCMVSQEYRGIVLAALISTLGVFAIMMVLYSTGIIKVTRKFRSFMISALIGIVVVNLLIFLSGLIFPSVWSLFYGNNIFSILASVVMVLFASFFILIDLSDITAIVEGGMEKKYEWRAAYGLSLTLIWLYLEFLRLFLKIASRAKN